MGSQGLEPASAPPVLTGVLPPPRVTQPRMETIPQGSSPRLFHPLNHAFFCPYLALIWLLGSRPGRVCRGSTAQQAGCALRSEFPFLPLEVERAPGRPAGLDAGLPGQGVRAVFLSIPKRRILSQMFL